METRTPSTLSAVILAGGISSRMGRDKALLPYQGFPLLRRVYDLAQLFADPVYVVTPWRDRYASILPDNSQWIVEPLPTQGPLVGFALSLPPITTEWIVLLPCDLPRLTSEFIAEGARQLASVEDSAIAFLPRHTKGWEPLCGFYRRKGLSSLSASIAAGERSFQRWLASQTVQEWVVENPQTLWNCNTPDDWQLLDTSFSQ